MRKLLLGAAMLLFAQMGFSQAVTDQAVVPVSVTLNSILRLTVTSGGNIVFVVNTINQYTGGIALSPRTTTTFRVSSTRDYNVTMVPENTSNFVGLETNNTLDFPNANLGFRVTGAGTNFPAITPLGATHTIVTSTAAGNVEYLLAWELATAAVLGTDPNLLAQSIPADIYVNNIFLTLSPQP